MVALPLPEPREPVPAPASFEVCTHFAESRCKMAPIMQYGGEGADRMWGGDGADELHGDAGDDELHGGEGADTLYGNVGDDTLYGGAGADRMWGGEDADVLEGGAGDDTMWGGAGADRFVYAAGDGNDTIEDFTDGADLIDLTAISGIAGFEDLTITAAGGDALIDLTAHGGGTIRLQDVDTSDLDAADFLFFEPPVDPSVEGI